MNINELKNRISSGAAALSQEDRTNLVIDFNRFIKSLFGLEKIDKDVYDIFDNIYSSNLADEIAQNLDEKIVYELGVKLSENGIVPVIHGYLNLIRNSNFLLKIEDANKWAELISKLIDKSNYTFSVLFEQRIKDYGNRVFFRLPKHGEEERISWNRVGEEVQRYSKSLILLRKEISSAEGKVAFLLENCVEMALLDFTCLKNGIVNVMIPANSVDEHIKFILNETKAEILFVQNEKQLYKINKIRKEISSVKKIILIEGRSIDKSILSFNEFLDYSKRKEDYEIQKPMVDDIATIMYTSGTTGEPKGIMFSHKNLTFKRFCRALALPAIGDKDRFLSYLPLFHTFGRYLELMGAFFWGAEYAFMENPSVDAMLSNMKQIKPTIFISIPKKWIQIYDYISSHVNVELDPDESIDSVVKDVTGGELKFGLSAAGFLPPEIFQFFQRYGIELMSGFGMTEATGGITMTPPGKYKYNSLGSALPGIQIKLAGDGELLIKGEYVMAGYFNQPKEEVFENGWFATGDIMTMDEDGFIEIIDRKKEIYKNIKGETIAPQKIENYFRDFETIKQVFLVGDHRPYNTVLIYPNYENDSVDLKKMDDVSSKEYFSSMIVSINKFLAPFERILDFRIIERPFDMEHDELTPKGTYKRRVIEKNFEKIISSMYLQNFISVYVDILEVRVPNWFLREKGCLSHDIRAENNGISIPKQNLFLSIELIDSKKQLVKIGSFLYKLNKAYLDFQALLTTPVLWLGNRKLVEFTGDGLISWARKTRPSDNIKFYDTLEDPEMFEEELLFLGDAIEKQEYSLRATNSAYTLVQCDDIRYASKGLDFIYSVLADKSLPNYYLAVNLLSHPQFISNKELLKQFVLLIDEHFSGEGFISILERYLIIKPDLFDKETAVKFTAKRNIRTNLELFDSLLNRQYQKFTDGKIEGLNIFISIFNILESLAAKHPTLYHQIRRILTNYQIQHEFPELSELAAEYKRNTRLSFRNWLGENQNLAVDSETGEEYEWQDVIIVDEMVPEKDKIKLIAAITNTPLLREAIFLFSKGKLIRLNDILPGGIWISMVRDLADKRIYRASVQTRFQGSFDILINIIDGEEEEEILEEINWLILAGTRSFLHELVEDFGGFWNEYNLWTANYLAGESVAKYLTRESKFIDDMTQQKLYGIFPFFVWNASAAYFNFWKLTDFKLILGDASTDNFIVPPHDYQHGTKVISLSKRIPFENLPQLFMNFYQQFVADSFIQYEFLKRESVWYYIFSGFINCIGFEKGIELLNKLLMEIKKSSDSNWEIASSRLEEYLSKMKTKGYIPKQLFFAIKRYHRWFNLNKSAEPEVCAQMLMELYDTYNLNLLEENYPAVRLRFFTETVFSESSDKIRSLLEELINKFKEEKLNYASVQEMISKSGVLQYCSDKEKFYLTRLSFPHLQPQDTAEFVNIKVIGKESTNLVIQQTDVDGNPYSIRNPISPKEIAKLHKLFMDANLPVNFRPEHDFLVAISERGFIIGGLFFIRTDEEKIHMEKIVVSNAFRRKGVSEGLMKEFFNRAKGEGYKYVTTGFFRPEYFYKFGFKVAPKYSGLVKKLD